MSMLAEPRRKQKWSVDPRNSAWSKDDSKFGQKMLERMGWSKGEGLGRSGQGATEHIKVRVKNDSYGLGANAADEDKWISHQDDFNELLAELNNQHSQNNNTTPQSEEGKGFSLEEKSKKASKRVHYMKFTKGKDLSSRTETDLNCIFGKRAKPAKPQEQVGSSGSDSGDQDETIGETKTVTSALSMQEYFAQRMAQLKRDRGAGQNRETTQTAEPHQEPSPNGSSSSSSSGGEDSEKAEKKKKKKKKSKKAAEELKEAESCGAPQDEEEEEQQQEEHAGKQKKKRKMAENECAAIEDCGATSGVEQNCDEPPPSKKKKKKKKQRQEAQEEEEEELLNGHADADAAAAAAEEQTAEAEVMEKKKKKKKKKRQQQQDGETAEEMIKEEVKEQTSEKKSKKAKKRKHQ